MTEPGIRFGGRMGLSGGAHLVVCGILAFIWGSSHPHPTGLMMFTSLWLTAFLCILVMFRTLFVMRIMGDRGRWLLIVPAMGALTYIVADVQIMMSGNQPAAVPMLRNAALLTAIGMLMCGIATVMAGRWQGWRRFTPLLVGLYPLLVMFPFATLYGGEPGGMIVGIWGVPWLLLGYALLSLAPAKASAGSVPVRA